MSCASKYYMHNMVTIHIGNTIFVKNSSIPMLEVAVEMESDIEEI